MVLYNLINIICTTVLWIVQGIIFVGNNFKVSKSILLSHSLKVCFIALLFAVANRQFNLQITKCFLVLGSFQTGMAAASIDAANTFRNNSKRYLHKYNLKTSFAWEARKGRASCVFGRTWPSAAGYTATQITSSSL